MTVYRLIEAGRLAHATLVDPLAGMGLEPGDDAILFALRRDIPLADADLAGLTGLGMSALLLRLERLIRLDLITRTDPPDQDSGASRLTEKGAGFRDELIDRWKRMDDALTADLKPKHRKRLKRILNRFADLF